MVGLTYAIADVAPPVYRRGLSDRGIYVERGNPVVCALRAGEPRGKLMQVRD